MAIKKKLVDEKIDEIVANTGFRKELIIKDYNITIILDLIKDIKGLYFKGGTALQLTLLDHSRISEDIDFTINRHLSQVRKEIEEVINESKLFGAITQDKDVDKFVRLIVPYKTALGEDQILIDLNEKGKLLLEPELLEMKHFYSDIPKFSFPCLNREEMVAEKIAAAIGRNKPRDHYDIYQLIKHNVSFNMSLVKKKCEESGDDPLQILKIKFASGEITKEEFEEKYEVLSEL